MLIDETPTVDILNGRLGLELLLVVMVAKAAVLAIYLGSGTSGGLLAPMFMASAAMGGAFAILLNRLLPGLHLSPGAYALVGMPAVFGSAARATFAFIIFAFEITRDYSAVLPLMLVCVIADGVALVLLRDSIMTEKLARRGVRVPHEYEADVLTQVTVNEVMQRDLHPLSATTSLSELAQRISAGDPLLADHDGLPLVDDRGELVGVVTRGDILRALSSGNLPRVADIRLDRAEATGAGRQAQGLARWILGAAAASLPVGAVATAAIHWRAEGPGVSTLIVVGLQVMQAAGAFALAGEVGVDQSLGLDVVRRPTGGRAVWHDAELTYAVAAPIAAFGTLAESYQAIHARLAAALRTLGAAAELAPRGRAAGVGDGACFATPVGGEVLVHGKKVVGSAQVRHGAAFLQHGSILLDGSQEMIQAVSRQPSALNAATSLSAVLGSAVGFDQVATAILDTWGEPLARSAHPPIHPSVFRDPAWTWRR